MCDLLPPLLKLQLLPGGPGCVDAPHADAVGEGKSCGALGGDATELGADPPLDGLLADARLDGLLGVHGPGFARWKTWRSAYNARLSSYFRGYDLWQIDLRGGA